jgi:hypothetical protein
VSLVLVQDVHVALTKSITSNLNEVAFGSSLKITCVADGGRIPYYLDFSHTPHSSTTKQNIVLYDTKSSKTPTSVKVDQGANTLTYVYTVDNADYDEIGEYNCLSKNEAASKAEKGDEEKVQVFVGKCGFN